MMVPFPITFTYGKGLMPRIVVNVYLSDYSGITISVKAMLCVGTIGIYAK